MSELRTADGVRDRIDRYLHESGLGGPQPRVVPLTGDASDRKYFRIIPADGPSIVLALHAGPIDFATLPFANVGTLMQRIPLPVPAILGHSDDLGIVALQDLGDVTLQAHLGAATPSEHAALYRQAVSLIEQLQRRGGELASDEFLPYRIAFDVEKLTWELRLLRQAFHRGLSRRRRLRRRSAPRCRVEWASIVDELAAEPRVLCHRDYHSRNLMLHDGSLYIIDFQDARMGPDTYDLVSLLRDSYVDIADRELDELIAYFLALKKNDGAATAAAEEFRRRFDLMALQRNLKALGTFGYQTITRRQHRLHPVHPAHAALRAHQPGEVSALRAAARAARRHTSKSCAKFGLWVNASSGSRRTSITRNASAASTCSRLRRTASTASSSSPRGRISTTTIRRRSRICRGGWRKPGSSCAASTRRPPKRFTGGRWTGSLSLASTDPEARAHAVRETEQALYMARRIPIKVMVAHLGIPRTPGRRRRSRAAARRSIEELIADRRAARRAGRGGSDPERAVAGGVARPLRRGRSRRRRHLPRLRPRPPGRRRGRRGRDRVRAPDRDARPRQPTAGKTITCCRSTARSTGRGADGGAEDRLRGAVHVRGRAERIDDETRWRKPARRASRWNGCSRNGRAI